MNSDRFRDLVQPSLELMLTKHEDYGSNKEGSVPLEDYFPFGDKSYVQMLHVKTQRLRALVDTPREPNHEKIIDTVRDLLNYTVFYLDYLTPKDE
jgi:hypothetical protein